jgi:peptidoglycan/xylan/chitin deacetylase (PgdA/CDA1 family)
MQFRNIYYSLKPFIPRRLQIYLRQKYVFRRRSETAGTWPIDARAAKAPESWQGWPDGKRFALVLTHDVDTATGHDRSLDLMKLESRLGFRSSFNFVPRRYEVSPRVRHELGAQGFEVGVHGLYHDGKYYESKEIFSERAVEINRYIRDWGAAGFRSPSMLRNLEWIHELDIEYDSSTFDTDPFEPQPDGAGTIFPFWLAGEGEGKGYVELPYTLPQDFTLFILMRENSTDIWKEKLDWIAGQGGMALILTHPDYMCFDGTPLTREEYPARYYEEMLSYIRQKYDGQYWHVLPRQLAAFWREHYST